MNTKPLPKAQAANEEVMSINEELQSTNEELETSKEEIQAVNEELNTVNNELNLRMAELKETNDDLANLLNASDIGISQLGLLHQALPPQRKIC